MLWKEKIKEVMSEVSFVQSMIQKARSQSKNMFILVQSFGVKRWLRDSRDGTNR